MTEIEERFESAQQKRRILRMIRHTSTTNLQHTKVMRKGETAKEWYPENDVQVYIAKENDNLTFFLTHPSKGGGNTQIEVLINSQDFPTILAFMSRTDPEAAQKAMVEELRFQICGYDPAI
jgi:hypothetical protein